jgi:hypothetical protein
MQWLRDSRQVEDNQHCVLFSGPECQDIAQQILQQYPEHIQKGDISWAKFEDGSEGNKHSI